MTIDKAVNEINDLVHTHFQRPKMVEWLSAADGIVQKAVIDAHEGGSCVFPGYTDETPGDTELLVPAPYDECYIHWLASKIHYANGEYTKYNNSVLMFETELQKFKNEYKKTHTPKNCGRFRF